MVIIDHLQHMYKYFGCRIYTESKSYPLIIAGEQLCGIFHLLLQHMPVVLLSGHNTKIADKIKRNLEKQ